MAPSRLQVRGPRREVGLGPGHLSTPTTAFPGGRHPSPRQPGLLLPGEVPDLGRRRLLLLLVR